MKKIIITASGIYLMLFLVGPWGFYNELKRHEIKGQLYKDEVHSATKWLWDDENLMLCLHGVIDGEIGEIFLQLKNTDIRKRSILSESQSPTYRRVIELKRVGYANACEDFPSQDYVSKHGYFNIAMNIYDSLEFTEKLNKPMGKNYFLIRASDDEGANIYSNCFGVYKSKEVEPDIGWFCLQGIFRKKMEPSMFDYFIALLKDFSTMPIQWVSMFLYASGGIG